ncbi:MAG TPA: hypothetical protein VME18_01825 [Acidobacteriaceae bacterium]|nr:hypothetical protein [Acidobacteriaceae bacterium]
MSLAERVKEAVLARPFAVSGEVSTVTASFDVASSAGRSPLLVLRAAERAPAGARPDGQHCARCCATPVPLGMALTPECGKKTCEPAFSAAG